LNRADGRVPPCAGSGGIRPAHRHCGSRPVGHDGGLGAGGCPGSGGRPGRWAAAPVGGDGDVGPRRGRGPSCRCSRRKAPLPGVAAGLVAGSLVAVAPGNRLGGSDPGPWVALAGRPGSSREDRVTPGCVVGGRGLTVGSRSGPVSWWCWPESCSRSRCFAGVGDGRVRRVRLADLAHSRPRGRRETPARWCGPDAAAVRVTDVGGCCRSPVGRRGDGDAVWSMALAVGAAVPGCVEGDGSDAEPSVAPAVEMGDGWSSWTRIEHLDGVFGLREEAADRLSEAVAGGPGYVAVGSYGQGQHDDAVFGRSAWTGSRRRSGTGHAPRGPKPPHHPTRPRVRRGSPSPPTVRNSKRSPGAAINGCARPMISWIDGRLSEAR
jgi:hypothetical protein